MKMIRYDITDHYRTYQIAADDYEHAILTYAEITGLHVGADFIDADDLAAKNDLVIEEIGALD
jgi:hypothetical protein